jgi:hypothetical protein
VDGKFTLTAPADHPKLEDYKVDDVSRALEQLTFQAVKADADMKGAEAGHSVFTTADGLAVTVTVLHPDPAEASKDQAAKEVWAQFAAAGSDKTKAEADKLNARLAGWTYQIGSWKEDSLVPTLASLKSEEPAKPAAAAPGAAAPGTTAAAAPAPTAPAPGASTPTSGAATAGEAAAGTSAK